MKARIIGSGLVGSTAASHVIDGKGATSYGIGNAISRIAEVIFADQRSIPRYAPH